MSESKHSNKQVPHPKPCDKRTREARMGMTPRKDIVAEFVSCREVITGGLVETHDMNTLHLRIKIREGPLLMMGRPVIVDLNLEQLVAAMPLDMIEELRTLAQTRLIKTGRLSL